MDKDDFREMVDAIVTAIKGHVGEVAENQVRNITWRILNERDGDLRDQVRAVIRKQVAEEVGKHLQVQVLWRQ